MAKRKKQRTGKSSVGANLSDEQSRVDAPVDDLPRKAGSPTERGRQIRRDLLKGLLFMSFLVPLTVALEHSAIGRYAEQPAYEFLQSKLSANKIPIAIVNISKLNPVEIQVGGGSRAVTPREQLREIVKAVMERGARVVAIDVNFAPLGNGELVDPSADPDFFQFCMDQKREPPAGNNTPIILGVDWADNPDLDERRPELLVENSNYKNLFACIRIPHQTNELAYKIQDDAGFSITTLSAAIADAYASSERKARGWIPALPHWFAKQFSQEALVNGVTVDKFLVDYSALDALMTRDYTLATASPAVIKDQGSFLKDRIVIIGDGSLGKAVDVFTANGKDGVPGIYLHASAVYTLIKGQLYKVTWQGGMLIDSMMSLFILGSITGIRWYYKDRTPREVARHRLERLFTLAVGALAIVFGVWFVNYHRIMWLDFLVVVPLLLFNPLIERRISDAWKFVRSRAPATVDAVVFEADEEKHK